MKQELLDDLRAGAFVSSKMALCTFYYPVLVGAFSGGVMGCLTGQPSLAMAIAKSGLFFPLITANTIRTCIYSHF
jgi:hypothetical protein